MKRYYIIVLILVLVLISWYFLPKANNSSSEIPIYTPDVTGLPKVYMSNTYGFKINLPEDFTVIEDYIYQSTPARSFSGIKFAVPERIYKGTNLSSDSYISIERIPEYSEVCVAGAFLDSSETTGVTEVNGKSFTGAYSIGAGAGNIYHEVVYATQIGVDCFGVRYFIHYGVFQNYEPGSVTEFNKDELISLFDRIRKTIIIN